jgi:hypothetical protein
VFLDADARSWKPNLERRRSRTRSYLPGASIESLTLRRLVALDRHDFDASPQDRGQLGIAELVDVVPVVCGLDDLARLQRVAAMACFSRLKPTLHWSVCMAADVVVLPLHTRPRHRQHAMTCPRHYP